jgi:hypothetical protein
VKGGHMGVVESIDRSTGYVNVLQNGGNPGTFMTNGSESLTSGYRDGPTAVAQYRISGSVFLRPKARKTFP